MDFVNYKYLKQFAKIRKLRRLLRRNLELNYKLRARGAHD
jgi:hypothetical protein